MQHQEVSSVNVPTNVETAINSITFTPAQGSQAAAPVGGGPVPTRIMGYININPGTATTQVFIKVHQGIGIAGPLVGISDGVAVTAGNAVSIPFAKFDPVGANSYTISVQQISATGNGTINFASIDYDNGLSGLV